MKTTILISRNGNGEKFCFCGHCKNTVRERDNYCWFCGAEFDGFEVSE